MIGAWLCRAFQEEAVQLNMKEQASSCSEQGWGWGVCIRDGQAGQRYLHLAMGWLRWAQKLATSRSWVPVLQSV